MTRPCFSGGNIEVLAPPLATLAPEGYYFLFVVEQRAGKAVPSKGMLLKVTS
jgi:hypothetical protein